METDSPHMKQCRALLNLCLDARQIAREAQEDTLARGAALRVFFKAEHEHDKMNWTCRDLSRAGTGGYLEAHEEPAEGVLPHDYTEACQVRMRALEALCEADDILVAQGLLSPGRMRSPKPTYANA